MSYRSTTMLFVLCIMGCHNSDEQRVCTITKITSPAGVSTFSYNSNNDVVGEVRDYGTTSFTYAYAYEGDLIITPNLIVKVDEDMLPLEITDLLGHVETRFAYSTDHKLLSMIRTPKPGGFGSASEPYLVDVGYDALDENIVEFTFHAYDSSKMAWGDAYPTNSFEYDDMPNPFLKHSANYLNSYFNNPEGTLLSSMLFISHHFSRNNVATGCCYYNGSVNLPFNFSMIYSDKGFPERIEADYSPFSHIALEYACK